MSVTEVISSIQTNTLDLSLTGKLKWVELRSVWFIEIWHYFKKFCTERVTSGKIFKSKFSWLFTFHICHVIYTFQSPNYLSRIFFTTLVFVNPGLTKSSLYSLYNYVNILSFFSDSSGLQVTSVMIFFIW